jgi:ferredoxin
VDSPFEVLGLEPDADEEAIDRAYRERVKEAHPDHGGSVEAFLAVRSAYEALEGGYDPDEGERPEEANGAGGGDRVNVQPRGATTPGHDHDPTREDAARVEYLNYDVLADHGWEIGDDDLFEKAADAGLDPADYGWLSVEPGERLLVAAEQHDLMWPYACRGGACTNCAVMVVEGEMPPPADHILPDSMIDRGIRLSCSVTPITPEAKVLFNVKHLPGLDELRLPASRFDRARSDD